MTIHRPLSRRRPGLAALGLAAAAVAWLPSPGFAQLRLSLSIEGTAFLAYEPIAATLRIENYTGTPLTLGGEANPDWLVMRVMDEEGLSVPATAEKLASPLLEIPAGRFGVVTINIARYFRVRTQGPYRVYVTARLDADETFHSPTASFEISPGETIWTQKVGFARDGVKETRTYMLLRQLRGHYMRAYLRVDDDASNLVYGIFDLGLLVSSDQPSIRVDKDSRLWILHRTAPRSHRCSIYDPRLNTLVDRFFDSSRSVPRLLMEEDGSIEVVGGMEMLPEVLPAPGATPDSVSR